MRRLGPVLAVLWLARCGDASGPTAPRAIATPVPTPPSVNLAGSWTGTFRYDEPGSAPAAVRVAISQEGTQVRAQVEGGFNGSFAGILSGDTLTGYLSTLIDGVPYGGAASGTASSSSVRITTGPLRYQDWVMAAGNTMELSR